MNRIVASLRLTCKVLLVVLFAVTTDAMAQLCYTYRTVDIPTPTGVQGQTSLEGINAEGWMIGRYANQEPPNGYRVRTRPNGPKLTVQPYAPLTGRVTWPRTLNARRDSTGMMGFTDQPGKFTGYVRKATGLVQVVDVPGSLFTQALGINRQRDVVGEYYDANYVQHGYWRFHMDFVTIDAPGATGTQLTGINDSQDIVGWYFDAEGNIHGLHIVDGVYATLDAPGALYTFLFDIENEGRIVGLATQGDYGHGVLYADGSWYVITPGVGEIHAEATGINPSGIITGNYISADGLIHGFVATPQSCASAPALVALAGE